MYNPDNVEEKVHLAVTKQYSVCVCVCLSKLAYLFYNFLSTVINGLFIGANDKHDLTCVAHVTCITIPKVKVTVGLSFIDP